MKVFRRTPEVRPPVWLSNYFLKEKDPHRGTQNQEEPAVGTGR